jgi:sortase (surface protein transpeptidase)
MAAKKTLSKLKKGDIFRFIGKKKVYKYEGKDRKYGYSYQAMDDISASYNTKKDREIDVDFEF